MIQLKTYTIKSKLNGFIWLFKYHLNGEFYGFEILEGTMSQKQVLWLFGGTDETGKFHSSKFPITESIIIIWKKQLKANFEITVGEPDLNFDMFWKMYPYNALAKKRLASERFEKLTKAERIKLFQKIPEFIKLKTQQNQKFPYAEVFIHQRWWD